MKKELSCETQVELYCFTLMLCTVRTIWNQNNEYWMNTVDTIAHGIVFKINNFHQVNE